MLAIWRDSGKRVLLITHNIEEEEAVFLSSELLLLSPGPGKVVEKLRLNFGQRFADGEFCWSIKSAPEFIAQREYVLGKVFQQHERYCYEPAFHCEGNGATPGQGRVPLPCATQYLTKRHDLASGAGCLVRCGRPALG